MAKKKDTEPNWSRLKASYVEAVQNAFIAYKQAYINYLDCCWFDDDGAFCILNHNSIQSKLEKAQQDLISRRHELDEFYQEMNKALNKEDVNAETRNA